jgi:O-antigen ligase
MSRTTEKIERILFYAFLFFIPFQIRATISGGPPAGGEWDSVFLYLTDLLLIGFLFFAIINKRISFKKTGILLYLFLALAGISLFVSTDLGNSIFRLIKLLEFVLLYIYVSKNAHIFKNLYNVLIASAVFQAILAIVQFYKQSSLGLKFIEAGQYLPGAPGVATFISGNEKIMRAYGSFPHPNVLAVFLLLAIFCFYTIWIKGAKNPWLLVTSYGLLVFGLFLTFSRGAILVFLFISFIFLLTRFFQLRQLYHTEERLLAGKKLMILASFFVFFSLISGLIVLPYFKTRFTKISLEEEAIDLRFFYNKMAISMIKDKPLLGIGIGNFVNFSHNYQAFLRAAAKLAASGGFTGGKIPDWVYQPAHNLYLLIASEIGILGALIFLIFLFKKFIYGFSQIFKNLNEINPLFFLFVGFLILALSDHLFWTLQSGGIIFWLAIGLTKSNS